MSKVHTSYEVKRARHNANSHTEVHCAACGELVTGPYQSTAQPVGKGAWAIECSACGVVTWYDVDDPPKV